MSQCVCRTNIWDKKLRGVGQSFWNGGSIKWTAKFMLILEVIKVNNSELHSKITPKEHGNSHVLTRSNLPIC